MASDADLQAMPSPSARFSRIECRDNNKPPTVRASGHGGRAFASVRCIRPAEAALRSEARY
jgi:hypothetical protein